MENRLLSEGNVSNLGQFAQAWGLQFVVLEELGKAVWLTFGHFLLAAWKRFNWILNPPTCIKDDLWSILLGWKLEDKVDTSALIWWFLVVFLIAQITSSMRWPWLCVFLVVSRLLHPMLQTWAYLQMLLGLDIGWGKTWWVSTFRFECFLCWVDPKLSV